MNAILNQRFAIAVLTAIAALLTSTGLLPREISDAHIAQAATLLMALAAVYLHAHSTGTQSGASSVTSDVTNAAIAAAEHAVGEIVTASLNAIEAATPAPTPAPKTEAAPAGTITAVIPAA